MAQTKKSWQDYLTGSFGEDNQSKLGLNALQVGGQTDGTVFKPLPIGTSSAGTAVLVDLIGGESVTVTVGTVGINGFTGTAGTATATRLVATAAGALTTSGTITGIGTAVGIGTVAGVGAIGTVTGVGTVAGIGGTVFNTPANSLSQTNSTISIAAEGSAATASVQFTGMVHTILLTTPAMEDTDSTQLLIKDANGYQIYASGTKAEEATSVLGTIQVPLIGTSSLEVHAEGTQSAQRDIVVGLKYWR